MFVSPLHSRGLLLLSSGRRRTHRTRIPGPAKPAGHKMVRAFQRSGSIYRRKVWL